MKDLLHNKKLQRLFLLLVLVLGTYLYERFTEQPTATISHSELKNAIENKLSDTQVEGVGVIVKVLPDDTQGSQHQRLLVKLENDHVILIAHNIDLAPRVKDPKKGDQIGFYGEFEWNEKGGVVHWTHHDPKNIHPSGWLEHEGEKYE